MSVASSARVSGRRPCVGGGTRRHGRHGRTLPVVRSKKLGEDDADVVKSDNVTIPSAQRPQKEKATTTTAPTSRRELMTAAVSLAVTGTTTAPFVSPAFAFAEPTLVVKGAGKSWAPHSP
jgi:hypothetical protein